MTSTPIIGITNRLLSRLSLQESEHLLANCELVDLILSTEIYHAGDIISHVYFPIECFISLVTHIDNDTSLEMGLVGNEGMLGAHLILDVDIAPFTSLVQGAGSAWRIPTAAFLQQLEKSPTLRRELKRYIYVMMRQMAQTAACTHYHQLATRLARWLLMTHDRAHSNTFHITHLFLAYMLGVRRVGITKAAYSLQEQKLISYQRGNITILDRAGLEAVACQCYLADKKIYEQILK